jgi:hypothetical protein
MNPGQPVGTPAPVLVIHGVGDFAEGELIDEVAEKWAYLAGASSIQEPALRKQQLMLQGHAYAQLEQNGRTRFLEVNWSAVRRTTATIVGLLRNFALVMLTLTRLGVRGVRGSAQLGQPLSGIMSWLVLVSVECLLLWASLLPALSALLWKLPLNAKLGVGLAIAAAVTYLATWLWKWSRAMAVGALLFAIFTAWASFVACVIPECKLGLCGREFVSYWTGRIHSAVVLINGIVLTLGAIEIFYKGWRSPFRHEPMHWIKSFSRLSCLWLPAIMVSMLQPIPVAAMLLTFSVEAQDLWGNVFQQGMLFSPQLGYKVSMLVLASMVAILTAGALQYLLVRTFGLLRGSCISIFSASVIFYSSVWLAGDPWPRCRDCVQPQLLNVLAVMLALSVAIGYFAFKQRPSISALGRLWHPAGKYARYWAGTLLRCAPLGMVILLAYLLWDASGHIAQQACMKSNDPDCRTASDYFLRAAQVALLLLPFAAKPAAALIDALGDVFYWFVFNDHLNTRSETRGRFDATFTYLLKHEAPPHIIVLAHSQGTVIATDALCDLAQALNANTQAINPDPSFMQIAAAQLKAQTPEQATRITLVTIGSPLSSLYRSFFGVTIGKEFADLCKAHPQRYTWVNISRAADYIGSRVVLNNVTNYVLATDGDHTGYWNDAVLIEWLRRLAGGATLAQAKDFEGGEALVPAKYTDNDRKQYGLPPEHSA